MPRLMVASPQYRNECATAFADGLADLAYTSAQCGVHLETCF
jgi:hypothetical protein